MTDTDRLNLLESFAPDHVWIKNQVRDKGLLSSMAIPVKPVRREYAEKFWVPFWNSLREALDAVADMRANEISQNTVADRSASKV